MLSADLVFSELNQAPFRLKKYIPECVPEHVPQSMLQVILFVEAKSDLQLGNILWNGCQCHA